LGIFKKKEKWLCVTRLELPFNFSKAKIKENNLVARLLRNGCEFSRLELPFNFSKAKIKENNLVARLLRNGCE